MKCTMKCITIICYTPRILKISVIKKGACLSATFCYQVYSYLYDSKPLRREIGRRSTEKHNFLRTIKNTIKKRL
jgi:hypothetical protein